MGLAAENARRPRPLHDYTFKMISTFEPEPHWCLVFFLSFCNRPFSDVYVFKGLPCFSNLKPPTLLRVLLLAAACLSSSALLIFCY